MTEEEERELEEIDHRCAISGGRYDLYVEVTNWLRKKGFDYSGLIEKNLAYELL